MRLRHRDQILIAFVGFALLLLAGTFVPLWLTFRNVHLSTYTEQRVRDTQAVAQNLQGKPDDVQERIIFDRYPLGGTSAGWLIPVGDGEPDVVSDRSAFPDPALAPELVSARSGPDINRVGEAPAGRRLFIAVPVISGNTLSDILWVSSSLRQVSDLDRRTAITLLAVGAGALVLGAGFSAALAARLTHRLHAVAAGAARFGEGKLDEPIVVGGSDEVAELGQLLNEMAEHVDLLLRHDREFVASASHQLRTPLTAIRLRIEEVHALLADPPPQIGEYLVEMTQEIDRLAALTSRLLDLSASEGAETAEVVPVAEGIRVAVSAVEPVARRRSIAIDVAGDEGLHVRSLPGAFGEVVFNLVDNAVKFSPEGAPVSVSARAEDGAAVVQVADRGPGIDRSAGERVFEPFYRADRSKPGYGLGLAICRRACRAAGADLTMEPREGGGTVAIVRWPLAAVETIS